jgi:hypothetical protein
MNKAGGEGIGGARRDWGSAPSQRLTKFCYELFRIYCIACLNP